MMKMMMVLSQCPLFQDLDAAAIHEMLQQVSHQVASFQKDQLIAVEGDPCRHVSVLLSGQVAVQKVYGSGRAVTVATFSTGDIFGEVMVYADHPLPSTIMALTQVSLLQLPRESVLTLCQMSPAFLENFMRLLSNKVWLLNEKLKLLSYASIRQKITGTLLALYQQQQSTELALGISRQELADRLGIPRPSLSRELALMKADGLIDYRKQSVRLLAPESLEEIMLQ
ncbi:Crp/Fnr family transcriptional regulator [Anoxynatronum sibiricum]|uniref:Crp/Fnr family transcriptional regulator n=1 Tax=Anoxynatronum sibiricum TaxID=210623 RepID=A0ABU9VWT0_9CLOT